LFTLCSNISIFTIYANFDIIILLTDIHPIDFSTYSKSLLWQMPYTHTHTHTNEKNTFFISFFFFFFVALHHNRLSFFLSFLLISHFVKIFCLQFFSCAIWERLVGCQSLLLFADFPCFFDSTFFHVKIGLIFKM
jgi:hypothetical protein